MWKLGSTMDSMFPSTLKQALREILKERQEGFALRDLKKWLGIFKSSCHRTQQGHQNLGEFHQNPPPITTQG